MSSDETEEEKQKYLSLGADEYYTKPLTKNKLLNMLGKFNLI